MAELAAIGAALGAAASSVPAWVPMAASAATAGIGAKSAFDQAKVSKQTGQYNAAEMERAAAEERAAGTRKAAERREQTERVLSRQRAVAAASGAGASGTEGYGDLVEDTASRGKYLSDLDLAMGESAATGLEQKAAISRARGDAEAASYRSKGYAAIADGVTSAMKVGIKRAPMAASDDFAFEEYGDQMNDGWHTTARRARKGG